jgi:hypothetical protein
MRQITPTMGHEIHEEKRHITHDVNPAQIGIEFDAVERRPLLPPPHDVVCVQISVAFTHGPVPLAQRQQRPRFDEARTGPVMKLANGGDILGLLEAPLEHRQVVDDLVPDGGHVAQWGFCSSHRGIAMKRGDLDCERSHVAEPDAAGLELRRQILGRIELTHADRILHRGSATTHLELSTLACQGEHVDVKIGGKPQIEPQLLLAQLTPPGERRSIEKVVPHRLLDLVGEAAGEHHPGDVRLDDAKPRRGVRKRRR